MSLVITVRDMDEFRAANDKMYSICDWKIENGPYGSAKHVHCQKAEPPCSYRLSTSIASSPGVYPQGFSHHPKTSTTSNKYTSSWSFNDPEVKRQRRVAKYKGYAIEGKMKASLRDGFRWAKNKYFELVHG